MKKLILILCLILPTPLFAAQTQQTLKHRLAVAGIAMGVQNSRMESMQLINSVTDQVVAALAGSQRFDLQTDSIQRPLPHRNFETLTTGRNVQPLLAQFSGSDWILFGELTQFGTVGATDAADDDTHVKHQALATGSLRVIDSHSGQTITSTTLHRLMNYRGETRTDAEKRLLENFTRNVVNRLLKQLFPVTVQGFGANKTIFLSKGTNGDVRLKQHYSVIRQGRGGGQTIGTLTVTAVEPTRARGMMIDGGQPKKGDLLIPEWDGFRVP